MWSTEEKLNINNVASVVPDSMTNNTQAILIK